MPRRAEIVDKVTVVTAKIQKDKKADKLSVREKDELIAELETLADNLVAVFCKENQGEKRAIAMGILYERMVDSIYDYLYYRMGNQQDAEDLTARVFFKVLDNIDKYDNTGVPFSAWVYRIAHNLLANWHRDRSRRGEQLIEDLPQLKFRSSTMSDPVRIAESSEAQEQLLAAIRRLPDDRQQLILLKFADGLSNTEIGRIMGRSEGAIKSLYHRTLVALREEMGDTI